MLLPYLCGVWFSLYAYFIFEFMICYWLLHCHKLHDIVLLAQLKQEGSNGLIMWLGWRRQGKISWKHLLGIPRTKWEINSKMHLMENECEEGRWMNQQISCPVVCSGLNCVGSSSSVFTRLVNRKQLSWQWTLFYKLPLWILNLKMN